jgi:hypothetical protein
VSRRTAARLLYGRLACTAVRSPFDLLARAPASHPRRPPTTAAPTTSSARITLPGLCMVADLRSALADPTAPVLDPPRSPAA